ncbi:hypothetical protein ACMFMG_009236 [Clarireedia jacksonii]
MQVSRKQLVMLLKGQRVHIPDLTSIFHNWPQAINREVDSIRPDIEKRLESLFPGDRRLEKLKAADFALFGSCWWPHASEGSLRIVAYLAIWLFVWDDELDSEIGPLANDFSRGQAFRSDTIRYVTHCLGLESQDLGDEPTNNIIRSFKVIGDAICHAYTDAQRRILLEQMVFFMDCSEIEQRVRLSDELPTIGQYWDCRMGTSAVGVTLAVNEFANGCDESTMMIDEKMKILWDCANEIIWLVNDILSIKKELDQNTVDSLVPLLFRHTGSAQAAIDSAVASVTAAVKGFDRIAAELLQQYQYEQETHAALQRFINACRYNCTGNLAWSLRTKRYGICHEGRVGGISLTL